MKQIDVHKLRQVIMGVAEEIIASEPYLTEIDTIIGDGDHGYGMKKGFSAVRKLLETGGYETVDQLMKAVGMELVRTMGGASGVIFGTLFIGGLAHLGHSRHVTLAALAAFFAEGERAIERRGRARPGQKTMIDALLPATRALSLAAEEGAPLDEAFRRAYEAALQGVEASKAMQSRVGRSKNFREATVGVPDPGAVSTSRIFKALYEGVRELPSKPADSRR